MSSTADPVRMPAQDRPEDRLESWKEIAAFVRKGVRTVQRWERTEDLPVRRHLHERGGTVYAYKSEILEWYRTRQGLVESELSVTDQTDAGTFSNAAPLGGLVSARSDAADLLAKRETKLRWIVLMSASFLVCSVVAAAGWSLLHDSPPFTGLTTTALSVVGRASQPALSPDGQRIAFAWNGDEEAQQLDLYVKRVGSGPPLRLTEDPNNEHSPAWSPDGTMVAFLRDNAGLFVVSSEGGLPKQVAQQTENSLYGVGMSWSLDGRFLYFSERRVPHELLAIYQLSLADGSVERLTTPPNGVGDMYPAVAPEGRRLTFIRQSANFAADIYLLRIRHDGRPAVEPERLTFQRSRIAGLDWLPGGQGIVFSSDHSAGRRLWTLQLSWLWRHSPEPLAFAGEDAFQPNVAKAAHQRVVYSRRYWPVAIWRMDLGQPGLPADARKLIGSARQDFQPEWSPDGRRIAFVSTRTGHTEIWISQSDGSAARQLTNFGGPPTAWPAWSPDGQWLAFSSGSEGSAAIFVVPSSGGSLRSVTPAGMHCYQPVWSRDGQRLYFTSHQSGGAEIWNIPAGGGSVVRVTRQGGVQAQLSADGKWLYYQRDGIWRMPAAGGDEQEIVEAPVGNFAVDGRGIYFDSGFGDYVAPEIHFYDLASGRTTLLTGLDRRKSAGLSISPDGRSLLLPLNERQSSELVLLKAPSQNVVSARR